MDFRIGFRIGFRIALAGRLACSSVIPAKSRQSTIRELRLALCYPLRVLGGVFCTRLFACVPVRLLVGAAFYVLGNPLQFLGLWHVLKLFSPFGNYLSTMGGRWDSVFSVARRNPTHTRNDDQYQVQPFHLIQLRPQWLDLGILGGFKNLRTKQAGGAIIQ